MFAELRTPCCNRKVRGIKVTHHILCAPSEKGGIYHGAGWRSCPKCKRRWKAVLYSHPAHGITRVTLENTEIKVEWTDHTEQGLEGRHPAHSSVKRSDIPTKEGNDNKPFFRFPPGFQEAFI